MASTSDEQRKHASVTAALTVTFVAFFALAFVGCLLILDNYASRMAIEEEVVVGATTPTEPFYVLLIGSDSRKGTALYTGKQGEHAQVDQHSDIMTLMRIDPRNYQITLVTIPRDTVIDGQTNKINDALLDNDPEKVVQAVGDLTGTYADYYMMTTFIAFENLINAIGGIDINVPKTVSVPDPATGKTVTVKSGKNRHLDGSQALVLARARDEYGDYGDVYRQRNVRKIERKIIQNMLSLGDGFDVEHALSILEDDTKTNMYLSDMGLLALDFVAHAQDVTFYECTGPYRGETRESDGLWIVPENRHDWELLMAAVDEGLNPAVVNLSEDPVGVNARGGDAASGNDNQNAPESASENADASAPENANANDPGTESAADNSSSDAA